MNEGGNTENIRPFVYQLDDKQRDGIFLIRNIY